MGTRNLLVPPAVHALYFISIADWIVGTPAPRGLHSFPITGAREAAPFIRRQSVEGSSDMCPLSTQPLPPPPAGYLPDYVVLVCINDQSPTDNQVETINTLKDNYDYYIFTWRYVRAWWKMVIGDRMVFDISLLWNCIIRFRKSVLFRQRNFFQRLIYVHHEVNTFKCSSLFCWKRMSLNGQCLGSMFLCLFFKSS